MPKLISRYGVVDAVAGTDGWIEYTGDANAIPRGAKVLLHSPNSANSRAPGRSMLARTAHSA